MVCFFCDYERISSREKILVDNGTFYSFYDDSQVTPGHALVIPKRHVISLLDLEDDEIVAMRECIRETREVIEQDHTPDGYNYGVNEGEAAGQTQPHLHIHIIPRYKGDVPNPIGGVRNVILNSPEPKLHPD